MTLIVCSQDNNTTRDLVFSDELSSDQLKFVSKMHLLKQKYFLVAENLRHIFCDMFSPALQT